jgi:hypothetical protein
MSTETYDKNSDLFSTSPNLVLGTLKKQYLEQLSLIALSTPAEYAKTRAKVIESVKMKVISDLYTDLRDVLSKGSLKGTALIVLGGKTLIPNTAPQEIDSKILSIAKSLDTELTEIIDSVIPPFREVVKSRIEAKSAANL